MRKIISNLNKKNASISLIYQKSTNDKIGTLIGSSVNEPKVIQIVNEHASNSASINRLLRMNTLFQFSSKK